MKIYPIVEGHGEVSAVPVLLRRLLEQANCLDVEIGTPMRRNQSDFRSEHSIRKAVEVTLLQPECESILILFDGEDGCPVELASQVRDWARAVCGNTPCDVVIAYREYETWFLAALESLRGRRGIRTDAVAPDSPESRRGAKDWLEEFMPAGRAYSETQDQPALSAVFDLEVAFRRSRSFRKLVTAVGSLLGGGGRRLEQWPPPIWLASTG